MGGDAAGVDGSGEGAWALATPAEGFLAASGAGELAHLLHLRLFRHFFYKKMPSRRFAWGAQMHTGRPFNQGVHKLYVCMRASLLARLMDLDYTAAVSNTDDPYVGRS